MNADTPDQLLTRALSAHRSGNADVAEATYRQILGIDPNYGDALDGYAVLAFQTGRLELAEAMAGRAVASHHRNSEYLLHHGLILKGLKKWEACEATFRRAFKLAPQDAEIHFNLGMVLLERSQPKEGIRHVRRAVQLTPGDPNALNGLGMALAGDAQNDAAEATFREVLAMSPSHLEGRSNLVKVLNLEGRPVEAEVIAREGLLLKPTDPGRIELLARQLRQLERHDEALNYFQKIALIGTPTIDVEVLIGSCLTDLGRVDEAISYHEDLIRRGVGEASSHYNIGLAHKLAGRMEEAIKAFDNALNLHQNWPEARYSRALTYMGRRNFQNGLPDYEARWAAWRNEARIPEFLHPPWQGEPLVGTRLLIWAEQGIGDHLVFLSLLPHLIEAGADCTVETDGRLVDLFSRSFPNAQIVAAANPPDAKLVNENFDYQIAMGSLPFRLKLEADEFLAPERYLVADPKRVAECQGRLAASGNGPYIGISWRSTRPTLGLRKSIPLSDWAPILTIGGVTFVNLQYGNTDEDVADAISTTGVDIFTDPDVDCFDDLEGLVGLIENLDMVITTSNVTAHFAGALGKPTWLMSPISALWYWGQEGDTTLFYPSVRAFRQASPDNWDDVITAVRQRLAAWLVRRMA